MILIQDFLGIFLETIHIFVGYIIALIVSIYLLYFSKHVKTGIKNLNSHKITKKNSYFKIVYIIFVILIGVIAFSVFYIGTRGFREENYGQFLVFAAFGFIFMPIAVELLALIVAICRLKEFYLGNAILLALGLGALGIFSANVHDFIWCFV
jgi:tryptophan-rich sensory protein